MSTTLPMIVVCPNCHLRAQIDGNLRGKTVRCACGHTFVVPEHEAEPDAPSQRPNAAPTPPAENPSTPPPPAMPSTNYQASSPVNAGQYGASSSHIPMMSLPRFIPSALRISERRIPLIGAVIGIPSGLVLSIIIALCSVGTMLGKVFDLQSFSALIPAAILCMFCWSVVVCLFRWMRIRALEQLTRREAVLDAVAYLQNYGVEAQAESLGNHPISDVHPLYRRMRAIIRQWVLRPSLQDADILLQKHESQDEDTVHAGFNLVRTFIWAMPVMGLIGTVIGIALAVGGFASFLGGNVDDVSVIKTSLVGVTSGLSFAFLITLEGLLGALLTMLPAASLQAREEHVNATVQQLLTDLYLPMLGKVAPESRFKDGASGAPSGEMLEAWRQALKEVSYEVLNAVRDTAKSVLADLGTFQQAHREEAAQWVEKLGGMIGQITNNFERTTDDFLTRLGMIRDTMEQDRAQLQQQHDEGLKAEGEQQAALITAMNEHNAVLQQASGTVGQLVATTADTLKLQESLMTAIAQVGQMNLSDVSAAIAQYGQILREAQARMGEFSSSTRDILSAQATLQGAVTQLQETNFIETLTQFRETLARLAPLLKMLARPQLVLVPTAMDEEA